MNRAKKSNVDAKQAEQLVPISRVVFYALMEASYAPTYIDRVMEFLLDAQRVWKGEPLQKGDHYAGGYYLGRTYQALEDAEIIGQDGRVLNPVALTVPGRLDGRLCRPRGFAPVCYENTKAFKRLTMGPAPDKRRISSGR